MDATTLVSEFNLMLVQLSSAFTAPTAETFRQVIIGWALTPGAGTVTGAIRTLGLWATKHWTVYEKFFYRASWRVEDLSRAMLTRLIAPLLGDHIDLAFDDTTNGPRGRHVALAGWFKDASADAKHKVIQWSHNWVIGAVILRMAPWPLLRVTLPVLFALYRKPVDCDRQHPFATRQALVVGMLRQVAEALPQKEIRVAFDGIYATKELLGNLPPNANAVSRLRKNAALYQLIPPESGPRRGRPRKRGPALPPLADIARHAPDWQTRVLLKQGRKVRRRIHGFTCLWYHVCRSRPVRVVIVQDPSGQEDDLYLICTHPGVPDKQIAQRYYDRWGIEECIQEAKQQMGMERTVGWCANTVARQAPLTLIATTLVKLWYVLHAAHVQQLQPESLPWYSHKRSRSFRDMLGAMRQAFWQDRLFCNFHANRQSKKLMNALTYALCQAA
jgi:hypothetical protein